MSTCRKKPKKSLIFGKFGRGPCGNGKGQRREAKELKARVEQMEREIRNREEALKIKESQMMEKARERADRIVRENGVRRKRVAN